MSRELKFRAWDEQSGVMHYSDNEKTVWAGGWGGCVIAGNNQSLARALPVMQRTGLKDKNGVAIYEGDIITFLDGSCTSTESGMDCDEYTETGAIVWCEQRKGWDVTNRSGVDTDEALDENIEVVGNIYQNPNLLKP